MLRDYQNHSISRVYDAWKSNRNVMLVLPTGAGKTVCFSHIIKNHPGASVAIAHRQELVSQMSKTLAVNGIFHRIIAPDSVVRLCVSEHMDAVGRSYFNPHSDVAVAGVNTIIRRTESWFKKVSLWVIDEAHHCASDTVWSKAIEMFPNASGLGVTATPERADGKGLDGTFTELVTGVGMRKLINDGFLTDYRIFAPETTLDLAGIRISKTTGDYTLNSLRESISESKIVGDVVEHYLKIAKGKLGVTFTTDVKTAHEIADKFNESGVGAAALSAKTNDKERINTIKRFKNREILQLVNCDLFGEGFDLPAVEVVSMARPTKSYGLFVQQFGRALRPIITSPHFNSMTVEERLEEIRNSVKPKAIIIDHVNNVINMGLPDQPRVWTLEGRKKKQKECTIKVKVCIECTAVYERQKIQCPFCGHKPTPVSNKSIESVDGDLTELDRDVVDQIRDQIKLIDRDKSEVREEMQRKKAPKIGELKHIKRHSQNQAAQFDLRQAIQQWRSKQKGITDREAYKKFWIEFGVDVMTAQTLKMKDALKLMEEINGR